MHNLRKNEDRYVYINVGHKGDSVTISIESYYSGMVNINGGTGLTEPIKNEK